MLKNSHHWILFVISPHPGSFAKSIHLRCSGCTHMHTHTPSHITTVPPLLRPWPSLSWTYKLSPPPLDECPTFSTMSLPASPSELFSVSIPPPPPCHSGLQGPTALWEKPRSFLDWVSCSAILCQLLHLSPHWGDMPRMSLQSPLDLLSPLLPGRYPHISTTRCPSRRPLYCHPNSSREAHFLSGLFMGDEKAHFSLCSVRLDSVPPDPLALMVFILCP